MKRKKLVSMRAVQYDLGVAWPPAHRFVSQYGFGNEIVQDPDLGPAVSEEVADAVLEAFREETVDGHDYQKLDKFLTPDPRRREKSRSRLRGR